MGIVLLLELFLYWWQQVFLVINSSYMWRSYTSDHSNLLSSTFTYTIYSSTSELKFSKKWFSWPTKFLSKMEMTSHLFAQESLLQYLVLPSFPTKSRISLIWILFWRWRFHYRESKRDARTVEVETKVATKEGDWPTFYLAYTSNLKVMRSGNLDIWIVNDRVAPYLKIKLKRCKLIYQIKFSS